MSDLANFLCARLDEDQTAAEQMARYFPSPWEVIDRGYVVTIKAAEPDFRVVLNVEQERLPRLESGWLSEFVENVARHDPARVLRGVEAKRAILAEHQPQPPVDEQWSSVRTTWWCERCSDADDGPEPSPCPTLRMVTSTYADHPDYRPEWKP